MIGCGIGVCFDAVRSAPAEAAPAGVTGAILALSPLAYYPARDLSGSNQLVDVVAGYDLERRTCGTPTGSSLAVVADGGPDGLGCLNFQGDHTINKANSDGYFFNRLTADFTVDSAAGFTVIGFVNFNNAHSTAFGASGRCWSITKGGGDFASITYDGYTTNYPAKRSHMRAEPSSGSQLSALYSGATETIIGEWNLFTSRLVNDGGWKNQVLIGGDQKDEIAVTGSRWDGQTSCNLCIGGHNNGTNSGNGSGLVDAQICHVAIFERALSDSELADIAASPFLGSYWQWDDEADTLDWDDTGPIAVPAEG